MRFLISTLFLMLCIIAGCTPIKVHTQTQHQSDRFNSRNFKTNGLALLPSTNKKYDRAIQLHAENYLRTYVGGKYVQPSTVDQLLNDTHMLPIYRDAIDTYYKTGISNRQKFQQVGTALKVRYLLKVDSGEITSQQRTESRSFVHNNKVNSNEIRKNTVRAIVIDCKSGKVVWEGFSESTAKESHQFFNRPDNNEIVAKGVSGLMKQLF